MSLNDDGDERKPLVANEEGVSYHGSSSASAARRRSETSEDEEETKASSKAFQYLVLGLLVFFVLGFVGLAIALSVIVSSNSSNGEVVLPPSTSDVDVLPLREQSQQWDIVLDYDHNHTMTTLFTEFTWTNLDVSPDGSTIVFDVLGDIYTVPIGGGLATPVLVGVPFETQPRYSLDGSQILFRSDRSGNDNLWRASTSDYLDLHQITNETYRFVNNGQWNKDGSSVVGVKWFTSSRSIPAGEIWIFGVQDQPDTQGRNLVPRVNLNAQVGAEEPIFDPSNTYVYYSENTADSKTNWLYSKDPHAGIYSILRVSLATNQSEVVTGGVGGAARPVISHDGKTLAFVRRHLFNESLILHDLATSEERVLYQSLSIDQQETSATHGVYPNFAFTPDDSSIVIWALGKIIQIDVNTGVAAPIDIQVEATIALADTVRANITSAYGSSFKTKIVETATVSGNLVFYTSLAQTYVYDKTTGSKNTVVSSRPPAANIFEFTPSVSPNGKQLAIASWDDLDMGAIEIVTLNPTTGQQQDGTDLFRVTTELGRYTNPRFSPSGTLLVYQRIGADSISGPRAPLGAGVYLAQLQVDEASGLVTGVVGTPQLITSSGGTPTFSASGLAVFVDYGSASVKIELSINAETGVVSVVSSKTIASGRYTTSIVVSPDSKYAAFVEFDQVYVTSLGDLLASTDSSTFETLTITAVPKLQTPATSGLQTIRGSVDGGLYLAWSSDSSTLTWLLGADLFSLSNVASTVNECAANDAGRYGLSCVRPKEDVFDLGVTVNSGSPGDDQVTYIYNGTVLTMDGPPVLDGCVVLRGSLIDKVGSCALIGEPDDVTTSINALGGVVMPGFIDAHAHWSGVYGFNVQQSYEFVSTLAFGVTTVHNPSLDTIVGFADAELIKAGKKVGPRIHTTGTILYGADGTYRVEVTELEDALENLRRLKAYGAWSVKSYNQQSRAARQMILQAAKELGMSVVPEGGMSYFWNLQQIIDGHTTIEHSLPVAPLYNDVLTLFTQSGTAYCPTFVVNYGGIQGERYWYQHTDVWDNERLNRFVPLSPLEGASLRRVMAADEDYHHFRTAESVAALGRAGVDITAGAHGQRDGIGYHWELWMFQQGGLTNLEVLRVATVNAARSLGITDVGVLDVGAQADVIIFPADKSPLDDLFNTQYVKYVIVDGHIYDAETMGTVLGTETTPLPPGPPLNTPVVGTTRMHIFGAENNKFEYRSTADAHQQQQHVPVRRATLPHERRM